MLGAMIGVPQLAGDPKLIALAKATLDRTLNSFTGLSFITIVTSGIDVPISALDGGLNNASGLSRINLPQA
jgi:hypothetical protein